MPGPWRSCACAAGSRPACRIAGKERALPLAPVTPELLRGILEQATQRSTYAMQEMTRCGFVTLPGGHRLGICGTAVVQNGHDHGPARAVFPEPAHRPPADGIADRLRDALWARPQSVLLVRRAGQRQDDAAARPHPAALRPVRLAHLRCGRAAGAGGLCLRRAAIPPWRAHGRAVRCTEGGGASSCCCAR